MNFKSILTLSLFAWGSACLAQSQKANIMIVGTDHLSQTYKKDYPNTDVLLPKGQRGIAAFSHSVAAYKPDMICVESVPREQPEVDSLYALYLQGKLDMKKTDDERRELYQISFRIGKELGLKKIYCVNAPGGTSQSVLDNGDNIELYKKEGTDLRAFVIAKQAELQKGTIGFNEYLKFINKPENIYKIYHLRYITPARVTNGKFKNPDAMIDTTFINPKYIGAELTATFKNRDFKIYSNIVTSQMQTKAKRVLLIIGAAHIGSLRSIFRDDDQFTLIEPKLYLK